MAKCFQTRVGEGPMPTEIFGNRDEYKQTADHLRGKPGEPGAEYGATTGRPRRVGWLDLPLLRYAIRVNGLDELMLTKLDVLSGLETVRVCVAYRRYGKEYFDILDREITNLQEFLPEYEHMIGWSDDISKTRDYKDLSVFVRHFVQRIEHLTDVPVSLISVGTDREQVICRKSK